MHSSSRINLLFLLFVTFAYGSANAYNQSKCIESIQNEEKSISHLEKLSEDINTLTSLELPIGKQCVTCENQIYHIDLTTSSYNAINTLATLAQKGYIVTNKYTTTIINLEFQKYFKLIRLRHETMLKIYGFEKNNSARNKIDQATKIMSDHLHQISACSN